MATEWFRNTSWNEPTERLFNDKLQRARNKEQYLRIQACTLARSHPEVALSLLDRYFELPSRVDEAQAHVDRATALVALGRTRDAVASYEAALQRETEFPNFRTQAYLELPYLVATEEIRECYLRALELLQAFESSLIFPLDHFRWHAARALIAGASNEPITARENAERALRAADQDHSGISRHPSLGLITQEHAEVSKRLQAFL